MTQIDFLPESYRQRHTRRKIRWSRIVVVLLVAALLAGGSVALRNKRLVVAAERDLSAQRYDAAMNETKRLTTELAALNIARSRASLIAYLRQPWSRAHILSEILMPLPKGLSLQEVHLQRASDLGRSQPGRAAPTTAAAAAANDPAANDLGDLRREVEARPTVVLIKGVMEEATAVHRYVAALSRSDLFSAVDLLGIDRPENGGGASFRVRATLRTSDADKSVPRDGAEVAQRVD